MRKVTILIDNSELKESKTILFFTHKRVIRKEIMRKCLNQMFDFRLNEDEDILYFKFENEEDSFLFRLLKNFGYQLFAWFPEKYIVIIDTILAIKFIISCLHLSFLSSCPRAKSFFIVTFAYFSPEHV